MVGNALSAEWFNLNEQMGLLLIYKRQGAVEKRNLSYLFGSGVFSIIASLQVIMGFLKIKQDEI